MSCPDCTANDDDGEWLPEEFIDDYEPPTQAEVNRMFARARERWPYADDRSISNYVNMKLDGYGELQCQVQSGFADPPYFGDD